MLFCEDQLDEDSQGQFHSLDFYPTTQVRMARFGSLYLDWLGWLLRDTDLCFLDWLGWLLRDTDLCFLDWLGWILRVTDPCFLDWLGWLLQDPDLCFLDWLGWLLRDPYLCFLAGSNLFQNVRTTFKQFLGSLAPKSVKN